jgi:hypothetical protein
MTTDSLTADLTDCADTPGTILETTEHTEYTETDPLSVSSVVP